MASWKLEPGLALGSGGFLARASPALSLLDSGVTWPASRDNRLGIRGAEAWVGCGKQEGLLDSLGWPGLHLGPWAALRRPEERAWLCTGPGSRWYRAPSLLVQGS